ncbi:hypothetical protein [Hyalangium versicolor]|uniref:hypothetical protein n=1 Tax=Hyalangium versicolor TaxID=2861190 RepID=UPI001CCCAD95|nr:hypothetical protein [Hyalangium versicolor]
MKAKSLLFLPIVMVLGCIHSRDWFQPEDSSLQMLSYDAIFEGAPIDGAMLRALKVAADDFFSARETPRACIDTPEAHRYYAVRRGETIYVAIVQDPAYCGRAYHSVDSGVRYAISGDGRILRRLLDGEPDLNAPPDGGTTPIILDGGGAAIDVTVPPDARVGFPVSADAGIPSPDAGTPQP